MRLSLIHIFPSVNLTQNYTYDAYDRILSATETGGTSEWTQNYLYDQWGNRAVQTGSYIPNPNGTPTALTQFTNCLLYTSRCV